MVVAGLLAEVWHLFYLFCICSTFLLSFGPGSGWMDEWIAAAWPELLSVLPAVAQGAGDSPLVSACAVPWERCAGLRVGHGPLGAARQLFIGITLNGNLTLLYH